MYRNTFSHTAPTMLKLATTTEQFLSSLPAEFTKKDFDSARKTFAGHPLSLQTCRDYGIVVIARTEPASYKSLDTVFTDPKGRQYTEEEIRAIGRTAVEMLFDIHINDRWFSIYSLPNQEVEVEHPCERNIFKVDFEKFKHFLAENA